MAHDIVRILTRNEPRLIDVAEARNAWAEFRATYGFARTYAPLLTAPSDNAKFAKTETPVYGLALAPSSSSGQYNVCRFATPECRKGCVSFAGKGELADVQRARRAKTAFLVHNPSAFLTLVNDELWRAKKKHGEIVVRLNTFSDIPWERVAPWLFVMHADIHFYDYTKWETRTDLPANYTLTKSCSERTADSSILGDTTHGQNVAVVFSTRKGQALPRKYLGIPVIDGDASDNRTLDPQGVIVGLRAKGRMRSGKWNMVREVA